MFFNCDRCLQLPQNSDQILLKFCRMLIRHMYDSLFRKMTSANIYLQNFSVTTAKINLSVHAYTLLGDNAATAIKQASKHLYLPLSANTQ